MRYIDEEKILGLIFGDTAKSAKESIIKSRVAREAVGAPSLEDVINQAYKSFDEDNVGYEERFKWFEVRSVAGDTAEVIYETQEGYDFDSIAEEFTRVLRESVAANNYTVPFTVKLKVWCRDDGEAGAASFVIDFDGKNLKYSVDSTAIDFRQWIKTFVSNYERARSLLERLADFARTFGFDAGDNVAFAWRYGNWDLATDLYHTLTSSWNHDSEKLRAAADVLGETEGEDKLILLLYLSPGVNQPNAADYLKYLPSVLQKISTELTASGLPDNTCFWFRFSLTDDIYDALVLWKDSKTAQWEEDDENVIVDALTIATSGKGKLVRI